MRILVIGGGPAGCGAAYRLRELGHDDWHLYEQERELGGLSGSFRDEHGFSWDYAGHAFFSKEPIFQEFLTTTLGDEINQHTRVNYIRSHGELVPYPFERNIMRLPRRVLVECLSGLAKVDGEPPDTRNFLAFLHSRFGAGICEHFMVPYNEKVWAYPLDKMSVDWIGDRVSLADFGAVLDNVLDGKTEATWGPNHRFQYPKYGGAGEPYRRFGKTIQANLSCGVQLTRLDVHAKRALFTDGRIEHYDALISSLPLDALLRVQGKDPAWMQGRLDYNSVLVVGIGVKKPNPHKWHWVYYPDKGTIFHRVVNHSKYSPDNVPDEQQYHSILCEVAYSPTKPLAHREFLVERCIGDCIRVGALEEADRARIASTVVLDIKRAYPIPTLCRDAALREPLEWHREHGVYSVGRFGQWRYETGNMDHCFLQGYEAASCLFGNP